MPMAPRPHRAHNQPAKRVDNRLYSAAQRGYGSEWGKVKAAALRQMVVETCDPWCRYCGKAEATTLDHALPPSRMHAVGSVEYEELFWSQAHWIPCCVRCNSEKQDMMPSELKKRKPEMYRRMVQVLAERGVLLP